jgi:hypothetical protein
MAEEGKIGNGKSWILLIILIFVILGLIAYAFLQRGKRIEGRIQDAITGLPVSGALISSGTSSTTSDERGRFRFRVSKLGVDITINAAGYEPFSTKADKTLSISLIPLPEKVAEYWFNYWKLGDYEKMYDLLSTDSRKLITKEAFQQEFSRYKLEILDVKVEKTSEEGNTVNVNVEVGINTPFGRQTLRFPLQLIKEERYWKVIWYGAGQFPPGNIPSQ